MLAAAGAVSGATYGAIVGDVAGEARKVVGAALIQIPAVWVVVGVALALFGLLPRLTSRELGSAGGVPAAWTTRSDTPVPAMVARSVTVQSHPHVARRRFRDRHRWSS